MRNVVFWIKIQSSEKSVKHFLFLNPTSCTKKYYWQVELEWKTKKFIYQLIFLKKSFFLNNSEDHVLILIIFLVWIGRGITFQMAPKVKIAYDAGIPYLFLTVKTTGEWALFKSAPTVHSARKKNKEDTKENIFLFKMTLFYNLNFLPWSLFLVSH